MTACKLNLYTLYVEGLQKNFYETQIVLCFQCNCQNQQFGLDSNHDSDGNVWVRLKLPEGNPCRPLLLMPHFHHSLATALLSLALCSFPLFLPTIITYLAFTTHCIHSRSMPERRITYI